MRRRVIQRGFLFLVLCCLICQLAPLQSLRAAESSRDERLARLKRVVERQGFERTEQEILRALEGDETNSELIESLVLLYVKWKRPDRVMWLSNWIPSQKQAWALQFTTLLARSHSQQLADEFLENFLKRTKPFSWKLTFLRATLLFNLKRHQEVIQLLTSAPESHGRKPNRHYLLAMAYQGLREWKEALFHIRQARTLRPEPTFFFTEASFLILSGDKAEAARVFQEGERHFPSSPQLLAGYAKLLSDSGDYHQAAALFKKAIQLDENYAEAYVYLARLFYLVGDWDSFRPTIKKALELQPTHFLACYYYGQLILLDRGKRAEEKALEFFKKSVESEKKFAAGHIAIGRMLGRQGLWREALESYQRAANLDPRNLRVYYLMAQAYRALGQPGEAKKSLAKAGLPAQ